MNVIFYFNFGRTTANFTLELCYNLVLTSSATCTEGVLSSLASYDLSNQLILYLHVFITKDELNEWLIKRFASAFSFDTVRS